MRLIKANLSENVSNLFTDSDFISRLSTENRNVFQKIYDEVKYLCRVATAGSKEARELEKVKRTFEKAYKESGEAEKNTAEGGARYSIVALDNGNVYVKASRKVIKETNVDGMRSDISQFFNKLLDGKSSIDIPTIDGDVLTITKAETADKARDNYKTINGKRIKMTDDEFAVKMHIESHIDEVAEISTTDGRKRDGKNHSFAKDDFTYRRTYFQDFDGQYYEVTLSIGHNGTVATVYNVGKIKGSVLPSAKILAVVGSKPLGKTSSKYSISDSTENVKQKQLEIIEKVNPAPNTYNTWIRKVEDIKTLAETLEDSDWADGDEFNPDLTRGMIEEAIESGEITVYSSYPIGQGVFVSPSYMEAASYSGDGNVYEKTVKIDEVAWIDPTQGMYANTADNYDAQFSLSENLENTEKILYNKNGPLAIVNRAKTAHNSSLKWVYDAEIFSVEESILFHEKISEINQGSQAFSKNSIGEYMIPVENKIIFTDGNYDSPYVREIVEVLTECEDEFQKVRERIFNVEKGRSSKQDAARYVQNTYGKGRIVSYTSGNNGVYGWEDGGRKGRTRSSVIRNHLNKQFRTGNDRASRETPINENININGTSSTGDVFSLSTKNTTPKKYGDYNVSGEDIMLQSEEDIVNRADESNATNTPTKRSELHNKLCYTLTFSQNRSHLFTMYKYVIN